MGRGATSIVFDLDEEHVLMFTRDGIKKDYLVFELGLGEVLDVYESNKHPIRRIREMDIYVLKVKKLEKLSKENKAKVKTIIAEFDSVRRKHWSQRDPKNRVIRDYDDIINKHEDEFNTDHDLAQLMSFLSNYDENQYEFDLGLRNVMQTKDGKIVFSDPIASKEIIDTFNEIKRMKYR